MELDGCELIKQEWYLFSLQMLQQKFWVHPTSIGSLYMVSEQAKSAFPKSHLIKDYNYKVFAPYFKDSKPRTERWGRNWMEGVVWSSDCSTLPPWQSVCLAFILCV